MKKFKAWETHHESFMSAFEAEHGGIVGIMMDDLLLTFYKLIQAVQFVDIWKDEEKCIYHHSNRNHVSTYDDLHMKVSINGIAFTVSKIDYLITNDEDERIDFDFYYNGKRESEDPYYVKEEFITDILKMKGVTGDTIRRRSFNKLFNQYFFKDFQGLFDGIYDEQNMAALAE